jgi:Tol biopolymer transport system component
MTDAAARWRRVEELCQAALERDARDRATFLVAACGDDHDLRREVDALLAREQSAEGFLGSPLGAVAANVLNDRTALLVGRRVGVYEIVSPLGAGGMGEVYRARDTRLGREVAIKIVPRAFKDDPDRLARFEREARLLASLNHPHIGAIYGLEEADDVTALVMELVEGDDLSQRIGRGAIPIAEALPIARQIAEALEAAHEQGIIHRDLKPANIKVRADGTVKVLDFGLAKALDSPSGSGAEMMNSPTLTPRATMAGTIIGTAAYMAPEQARGKVVDRRADIWAFGVVVYEMLTGRRPFDGDDISVTLASVLKDDVNWKALPSDLPVPVRRLLRRCLEKDPGLRLSAIGDARLELDDAAAPGDRDGVRDAPVATPVVGWEHALPWAIAIAAIALALYIASGARRPIATAAPVRLSADLGADVPLTNTFGAVNVLSPDSALVAFVGQNTGSRRQLFVRRLSELRATPLSGTDDADSPFFSPDGHWIAFFAAGKLKKISVTGGSAFVICDAPNGRGGAWAADGTIVFSPDSGDVTPLVRVSSDGGTSQALTALDAGEISHRWPQLLPGGKGVLFTADVNGTFDDANLVIQKLPAGLRKVVHRGGYYGRYLASGHLAFVHEGTLFAVPFDVGRLEASGPPVRVVEGIASSALSGGAQFDVSPSGTLVYLPGIRTDPALPMHWMDRAGRTTLLRQTPAYWINPRFAPDGNRIALQIIDSRRSDIGMYELARDTVTRLTSDGVTNTNPIWTPDGRRVVFSAIRGNALIANLYWRRADATGEPQRLTESGNPQYPSSWHPSGKFLAFEEHTARTASDLMILPMEGDEASGWKPGKPTAFVNSPASEREPMFSPDGRWMAYVSNESGRYEVYVRPYGNTGGVWQISASGGEHPIWSPTTRDLFYSIDGQITAVSYQVDGDSFRAEKPRRLADTRFVQRAQNRMFDVHPNGDRFVLAVDTNPPRGLGDHKAVFVFDFFNELRRLASVTK